MSYFSVINQGITNLVRKNLAKFDGITDPILKKTAETLDVAIESSTRIFDQLAPEDAHLVKKELVNFTQGGISQGEIKQLLKNFPELAEKLEILADEKLINTILARQGITKEHFSQILCNVTVDNKEAVIKFLSNKEISNDQLYSIIHLITEENTPLLQRILKEEQIDLETLRMLSGRHIRPDSIEVLKAISKKGNISPQNLFDIMNETTADNAEIAIKMLEKSETVDGISPILRKLRKPLNETEESLKIYETQKKFFSELLDNPEFKLPEDELECYRLSKVISTVTPENIDIVQKAVLSNVKAYDLDVFTKGITKENKALASRILDLVEGEVKLPPMSSLKPEHLEKYLDKVEKISDSEARKLYIEALEYLADSNVNEVLPLIKSSDPAEAKHAAAVIKALGRGFDKASEIEPAITLIEKSGRQIHNDALVNLAILSRNLNSDSLKFFKKILSNPNIHDYDLESYLIAYMRQVENAEKTIKLRLSNSFNLGEISEQEFSKRFSNLDNEVTRYLQEVDHLLEDLTQNKELSQREVLEIYRATKVDNIGILKTYATNPAIKRIDPSAINVLTKTEDIEAIVATDIPKYYQREILPVIRIAEEGGTKRLEIAQNLAQRKIMSKNIANIIRSIDDETMKYIDDILARTDFDDKTISYLIEQIKNGKGEVVKELLQNPKLKQGYLKAIIRDNELIMPVYKANPEQIVTALEHKMPLVHNELFGETKLMSEILGERRYAQVLKGLQEVKAQYGIEPKETLSFQIDASAHSNDLFIVLKDNDVTYKFNKRSGKLISVQTKNETINIRTKTRTIDSVSSESKLKFDGEDAPEVPYHIETVQKGKKGTLRTIYSESGIKGQYDIYHTKPDGTRIKVGRAQVTPNGAQHVNRTLTSANGHKTSLSYRQDAAGNTYLHSVIKNETGEVISEVTRKRIVISENHFITSCNNQAYDIVFNNDRVVVTKLDLAGKKTKETVEYVIRDIPVETADKVAAEITNFGEDEIYKVAEVFKRYGIEPRTIDRRCVAMLKELPGDEWFAMNKSAEFVMPQSLDEQNAFFAGNSIFMGKEHMGNLGVYCHELGHAKFHVLGLANDPELLKIYNAEKRLYTSTFPESRVKSIDYFLEENQHDMRGLNEACAETNLITDTIQSWEQIQDRTIFYEQYFPETIAYIRKKYAELV